MAKKKLYCPNCKLIFSPIPKEDSEEPTTCPQCSTNIDKFLPKKHTKKIVKEAPKAPVEISEKEPHKKLLAVDLNKIPSVSSRTSDAKNNNAPHYEEPPEPKQSGKKDFQEEFLDLKALKKRQLQALQRKKKINEVVETNPDSEEIAFEGLKKENGEAGTVEVLDEDEPQIPENKKELLDKIDQLIHQTKEKDEEKHKKKHKEKHKVSLPLEKEKKKAEENVNDIDIEAFKKAGKYQAYPGKTASNTSFSTKFFMIFLTLLCGYLQWQVWNISSSSKPSSELSKKNPTKQNSKKQSDPVLSFENRIKKAIDIVAPSVVSIQRDYYHYEDNQKTLKTELGSGFFLHKDGYILTNYHVIENGEKIWCFLKDGRKFRCEVMGKDPIFDLAVLRLDTPNKFVEVTPAKFRKSKNKLAQGNIVLALGNPAGLAHSFSLGVVSHTNRYLPKVTMENSGYNSGEMNIWLQTDTSINQGNSGGPLFNLKGEVVGINTRTMVNLQNISFALPINSETKIITQTLMSQDFVERSFIGVILKELPSDKSNGVLISHVLKGSPAEKAGIQQEDILLEAGPYKFMASSITQLPKALLNLSKLSVGKNAKFLIERHQSRLKLELTPRMRESYDNQLTEFKLWGFSGTPISNSFRSFKGISATQGLYIETVEPEGIMSKYQLSPGCVILSVNKQQITSYKDFKKEYDKAYKSKIKRVEILVMREDGISETLILKLNYH